jgi:hypothetical protein
MAHKSDLLENEILNRYLRNTTALTPQATVYVALFSTAPTDAYTSGSPTGTEVSWGAYARVAVTFSAASGGATANSADVLFAAKSDAGSVSVVAFSLMDALTAGNLLYWNTITSTPVAQFQQAKFAIGNITVSED